MWLYEEYFADIDALTDEKIAEFRKYHDETLSLIKYYYMDIPLDVCIGINEFEDEYSDNLLGDGWHKYLFDIYNDYKKGSNRNESEKCRKADFAKQALSYFYDSMDYVFREGFGTESKTAEKTRNGIFGLLFGKGEE